MCSAVFTEFQFSLQFIHIFLRTGDDQAIIHMKLCITVGNNGILPPENPDENDIPREWELPEGHSLELMVQHPDLIQGRFLIGKDIQYRR